MFIDKIEKVVPLTEEEAANLSDLVNRREAKRSSYVLAMEDFDKELELLAAVHGVRLDGRRSLCFGDGCIVVSIP